MPDPDAYRVLSCAIFQNTGQMSVLKYRRQEVLVGKQMHMYVGSLWSLSSFPMTKYNSANKGASPSCFQCYSTNMKRGNELVKLLGTKATL